jgi:hypothetical protein
MEGTFFAKTDSYSLMGIRVASMMWANHMLISTESDMTINIPEPKKLALQNICLANSEEECATPEAQIIFAANKLIDNLYFKTHNSYYDHRSTQT